MIMSSLFPLSAARRQAGLWLDAHGDGAIILLSDRIAKAMRAGDERGAVRLDKILHHVEKAVDAAPGVYAVR